MCSSLRGAARAGAGKGRRGSAAAEPPRAADGPGERDEGQGGRPGSFCQLPAMELLVAGQGAEPPEEALACWGLKEGKRE